MNFSRVIIAKKKMRRKTERSPLMIWNENRENTYCEITPAILALKEQWEKKNYIK